MRVRSVVGTVGWLLLLFGWSFLAPLFAGLYFGEPFHELLLAYAVPLLFTLLFGLLFWLVGRDDLETVREREAFVAVGFGWLFIAFLGSLPYIQTGTLTNPIDAYFESMSGFATCGATTIAPPADGRDYLDVYSHSIFLWRALTQWLGGMGIIVLSVVILAKLLGGGLTLFKAEVSGHSLTRLKPKLQETARLLWGLYALFTLIAILAFTAAGMGLFDAICHAFTALATGGFSTHTASAAYWGSPLIEALFMIFVLLGSVNFVLSYNILKGDVGAARKDQELRLFFVVILIAIAFITLNLMTASDIYDNPLTALRYSSFQVVSMTGTAGFTTWGFSGGPAEWPAASQFLLVALMLLGGCVGSTSGAIKMGRILILLKAIRREVQTVIHPRAVMPIKVNGRVIPEGVVAKVGAFFSIYLLTFLVCSSLLMMLDSNLSIMEAISAIATSMGGVGPGLGSLNVHCAGVSAAGKMLMALCMWIGRLEIFSALILFFPSAYKS